MGFAAGTYSVVVNFTTEAGSPPIAIAKLDTQMSDMATALSACLLKDGTLSSTPQTITSRVAFNPSSGTAVTITGPVATVGLKVQAGTGGQFNGSSILTLATGTGTGSEGGVIRMESGYGGAAVWSMGMGTSSLFPDAFVIYDETTAKYRFSISTGSSATFWRGSGLTASLTIGTNGNVTVGAPSSGQTLRLGDGTAITAGGNLFTGVTFTSTANFGVFCGSGAPSISAAKGSLYLRSDGTTTNDRAYINTNGSTTWTALTTAA